MNRDFNPCAEFEEQLRFESLVADLSSQFVNLPASEADREILDAQRRICECLGLELSALWQWASDEPETLVLTHLYRPLGGPPVPERMSASNYFPWSLQQLRAGKVVQFNSLEEAPPEAKRDQEVWRHYGIRNILTIPLAAGGGSPFGCVSFHTVRDSRTWESRVVNRLMLLGQVFSNVLSRRAADQALRESEARASLAADAAGAGLWILNVETGQYWITPKNRELFQFAADVPVTFEGVLDRVHPEDRHRIRSIVSQVLSTGQEGCIDYRVVLPDGTIRWMTSRGRPQQDKTGLQRSLMGVTIDITERKVAEDALRQSLAEIERLKERLEAEGEYLKSEIKISRAQGEIIGQSTAIRKVLTQAEQVACTDSTVLLLGETGTGKELVAELIHRLSSRRDRVLVKVNCAALPSALVESELFGREKGAFTGALTRQVGRFEIADGSTLFLDEIAELPPEVQSKLLRVLQEGCFERLGSPHTHRVNVRFIAATNRDLTEEVRQGRFRTDLFYRLNVFPIRMPPLRERIEDIPLLVWAFIEEFSSRMGKRITQVPLRTMERIQALTWAGNVRELRNVIEHAAIVTTGNTLQVPTLDEMRPSLQPPRTLAESEREHILHALEHAGWRVKGPRGAATALGLNPSTLYSRMQRLGIPHRRQKESDVLCRGGEASPW